MLKKGEEIVHFGLDLVSGATVSSQLCVNRRTWKVYRGAGHVTEVQTPQTGWERYLLGWSGRLRSICKKEENAEDCECSLKCLHRWKKGTDFLNISAELRCSLLKPGIPQIGLEK